MPVLLIGVLGCVAVLLYDAIASLVVRLTHARYERFAAGSLIIYLAAGYIAGREAESIAVGATVGAAVAAVEATIGWRVARTLGADEEEDVSERMEVSVATLVTLSGAAIGALGALIA